MAGERPTSGMPSNSSALAVVGRGSFGSDSARPTIAISSLRSKGFGAAFGRANCGHEGVLRTHHNDRQIGARLPDARNQIEGIFVGHDDIGDDQIAVALRDPAP